VLTLVAVAVPAFATTPVNVPKKFKKFIPKVKKKSHLAVRLPQRIYPGIKTYPAAVIRKHSYEFELSAAKNCHFATACFIASFSGELGGTPSFKKKVKLAHGITGYFHRITCGASCAPASIQWQENGVLYTIQNKNPGKHERRNMIKLANSAIRHGDR
jgi:hypothetical protein